MASPVMALRPVRSMAILLTGVLVAALLLVAPSAEALTRPAVPWDINGDGYAELVLGVPGESGGSGAHVGVVTLLVGSAQGPVTSGAVTISQETPGVVGSSEPGDRFGSGLTSCDFNADGYADLAVGANGERTVTNPHVDGPRGAVSVLYGSAGLFKTTGNDIFNPAAFGLTESWGSVLECGNLNGDKYRDLAVGEGFCCASSGHRGGVTVFYGSAQGLDVGATDHLTWEDEGDPPEPSSYRYAESIAIGDLTGDGIDDLVVPSPGGVRVHNGGPGGVTEPGATVTEVGGGRAVIGDFDDNGYEDLVVASTRPFETCVETEDCPGVITVVPSGPSGLDLAARKQWHPDLPGVAGIGGRDDFFGRAMAAGDLNKDGRDDLAIGASGKDVGAAIGTGGVFVLYGSGTGLTATRSQVFVQSSPGVPGDNETYDRFGDALVISRLKGGVTGNGLVIAAPRESVGTRLRAGTTTVLYATPTGMTTTGAKTWSQSSAGVPGATETDDCLGLRAYSVDQYGTQC